MTRMRELHEMRAIIHAYQDFSECIVDSIQVLDFGTTVVLSVDYIWLPDGSVRPDDGPKLTVELRARVVQEVSIQNRLNAVMMADPSALNWGFAEISRIEVNAEQSGSNDQQALAHHRMTVWREEGPWIQIVFGELEVSEARHA